VLVRREYDEDFFTFIHSQYKFLLVRKAPSPNTNNTSRIGTSRVATRNRLCTLRHLHIRVITQSTTSKSSLSKTKMIFPSPTGPTRFVEAILVLIGGWLGYVAWYGSYRLLRALCRTREEEHGNVGNGARGEVLGGERYMVMGRGRNERDGDV
jgi:hypothetical protein